MPDEAPTALRHAAVLITFESDLEELDTIKERIIAEMSLLFNVSKQFATREELVLGRVLDVRFPNQQ